MKKGLTVIRGREYAEQLCLDSGSVQVYGMVRGAGGPRAHLMEWTGRHRSSRRQMWNKVESPPPLEVLFLP